MNRLKTITLCVLAVLLCSCQAVSSLIHDGEVAAQVGTHKLYVQDLEAVIPRGLSPEDSANLAVQHIQAWAVEQLYLDMAEAQLSKEEKDVSAELEAYRRSLLKYRYEQRYVNERLDTTVTRSEIEKYYETHQGLFTLDVPILKARFLDIMQDSSNLETIRRKMSSDKYEDLVEADSLAFSSALRYVDCSEKWIDAVALAREFGTDYGTMMSALQGRFIEMNDEKGDVKIAYVLEYLKAGTTAPLEYSEDRIKDIILSSRKRALLSTLEQDLLKDARSKEKLTIYSSE